MSYKSKSVFTIALLLFLGTFALIGDKLCEARRVDITQTQTQTKNEEPKLSEACVQLTTPPWLIRFFYPKSQEQYWKDSVTSATRCCKKVAPNGDIRSCYCPLVLWSNWTKSVFEDRME